MNWLTKLGYAAAVFWALFGMYYTVETRRMSVIVIFGSVAVFTVLMANQRERQLSNKGEQ